MSVFQRISATLHEDQLLRRVVGSSAHLFTSNTLSVGLSVLQGALATRLLGPSGLGLIGIIMAYASTINSFFSFRMSELVVRYGGEYLEKGNKDKASALIKAAALGEAAVSFLAFLLVFGSAGWASSAIAKTPGTAWMFIAFALGLLANFNTETSTGILQITGKIKWQGTINLIQSLVTALVIVVAYFGNGGLTLVLIAYLLGKAILGLGMFFTAQWQLHRSLGAGWWKSPISMIRPYPGLIRFAVSSNISATIIKVFRDSELLWVGFFLSTSAAGYYKVAYTLAGFLSLPADPLISTTYPEINTLIIQRAWTSLRNFLRRITKLAFFYNLAIGLGFVLFGHWLVLIYAGQKYVSAYPALIVLVAGLAFNYTLFWNRPLLLSLGLPEFPILATMGAGLLKVALAFLFVPRYGFVMAAALLSFYYVASVGTMVWRGLTEIRKRGQETDSLAP